MKRENKVDIHQAVTDAIIEAIESNPGEYRTPWHTLSGRGLPRNAVTKASYAGMNIISLACSAFKHGFASNEWATYRQLQGAGLQVKRGEKGTLIVFYRAYEVDPSPDNPDDDGTRRVARHSHVFNLSQTEGWQPPAEDERPPPQTDALDRLIAATGADVRIGGDRAYYQTREDYIALPSPSLYRNADEAQRAAEICSTGFHEFGHWTGAPSRLARDLSGRFGSSAYSIEELVAETTAAFLCAEFNISALPRADHAQYLAHWLSVLKADNRAIFTAAARASEATRYLMSFLTKEDARAA